MVKSGKYVLQKLLVLCLTLAVTFVMCTVVFGSNASWTFTKGPYPVAGDYAVGSPEMNYSSTPTATVGITVTSVTSAGTAEFFSSRKDDDFWGNLFKTYTVTQEIGISITSGSVGKTYARTVKGGVAGGHTFGVRADGHSLNMNVNNVSIKVVY